MLAGMCGCVRGSAFLSMRTLRLRHVRDRVGWLVVPDHARRARAHRATDRVGGVVCLNNRYHDPTLGSFLSVDPLVTSTGQPYIYGAANPMTFADPSGLEPRPIHCRSLGGANCGDPGPDPYHSGCGGYGCSNYRPADAAKGALGPDEGWAVPGWRPAAAPGADIWSCGPPSGPSSAQAAGECGWSDGVGAADRLAGPPNGFTDLVPREVLDIAKNTGVAVIAVAGGVALCGTGVGCIVVASAAIGAGVNVAGSESVDCLYGSCMEFSMQEQVSQALEGAVIGGSSGYVRTNMSISLGSDQPAIGVIDAINTHGLQNTVAAMSRTSTEQALGRILRILING